MIQYLYLSRVGYAEALALQAELVELRYQGRIENTLLLLEHPPVLTLGRNATRAHILASDAMLAHKGVQIHEINRGGDVTYHGPGQLVGYPIFDLRSLSNGSGGRLGPVDFVRRMEEALIRLCASYGILTSRIPGRTGVWTIAQSVGQEKKIAAIGIHVSRGITSHGFAFNHTTDLRDFQLIVPCGIADREVTSLEGEIPDPGVLPTLAQLADVSARHFGQIFDQQILAIEDLVALRANAASEPPEANRQSVSTIQQIGAPLHVPQEVQSLMDLTQPTNVGISGRPVRT